MFRTLCPVPRGLAARIVWLGLALYDRIKRQAISPPKAGGTMETNGAAPELGSGEAPPMAAQGLTHTGRRSRNEDRFLIREDLGLAIVADGFSGCPGGDHAARLAVEAIAGCFDAGEEQTMPDLEPEQLADGLAVATARFAIQHAHRVVRHGAGRAGLAGMCSAVAFLVVAGSKMVLAVAGCVRAYRFRIGRDGGTLEELTQDASPQPAIAYPVGGPRHDPGCVVRVDSWRPGDLYLLCTAGLHRVLGAEPIRCTLAARSSVDCAAALVGRALHSGGADNMTVVLVGPSDASPNPRGSVA